MTSFEEISGLKGQVFNIQRYSTHDGPGIRTVVFLKGCPLRCFWCQNPESQKMEPVLLYKRDRCTACGRCIPVCPTKANSMVDGVLKFDRSLCIACGACVPVCLPEARVLQGATMTVAQVMTQVNRDSNMFDNSGGGLTISGGDCEMQPEFTVALLRSAHYFGYNTCVEITGAFPWKIVKMIADHSDFILFDLKHMDDAKHIAGTKVSNKLVLENAKKLVEEGKKMYFRTPLIPGFNDSVEDVRAIASFVKHELGLDPTKSLELLAYNTLGEEKYARMDFEGEHPSFKRQSNEHLQELHDCVAKV